MAREHRQGLEKEHYGLPLDQLHAAHALTGDTLDFMHIAAERDDIGVGAPGGEIAKLVGLGFVEISAANGHERRPAPSRLWRQAPGARRG